MFGQTKGWKLRYIAQRDLCQSGDWILNPRLLCAYAMFDVTCFPAFCRSIRYHFKCFIFMSIAGIKTHHENFTYIYKKIRTTQIKKCSNRTAHKSHEISFAQNLHRIKNSYFTVVVTCKKLFLKDILLNRQAHKTYKHTKQMCECKPYFV